MNLFGRSNSCWLITINYIQLPPLSICNGVIGVEEEIVSLFLPYICYYSFSNKFLMILLVLTITLWICWGDPIPIDSLPLITFNELLFQFEMVWLVWKRNLCHYLCRIFVPTLSQTNLIIILLVITIMLWICWGDPIPVDSLPLITLNYLLFQFVMVWLMWRRHLCHYFCRILGGCTRAIFSLLKESCLLPFYFQNFWANIQKVQISVQRIFVDTKPVKTCQYKYSLYCA